MVKTWPDVEPKTISMWAQAWIWTARFITTKGGTNVTDIHACRHPFHDLISFGNDCLLEPHFPDLINKCCHSQTPRFSKRVPIIGNL
jgi:hypothetical protein